MGNHPAYRYKNRLHCATPVMVCVKLWRMHSCTQP